MTTCRRCQRPLGDSDNFCSNCSLPVPIKSQKVNSSQVLPRDIAEIDILLDTLEDTCTTDDIPTVKAQITKCQQKINYLSYISASNQTNISIHLSSQHSRLYQIREDFRPREQAAADFPYDFTRVVAWSMHLEDCGPDCTSEKLWEGMNYCLPEVNRVLNNARKHRLPVDKYEPEIIALHRRLLRIDQMTQQKRHQELLSKRPLWKTVAGLLTSALAILAYWTGLPLGVGRTLNVAARSLLDYKEPPQLPGPSLRY